MIERTLLLLAFVISAAVHAQTPLPANDSRVLNISALLGAINGAKAYAERCFSTGSITSKKGIEAVAIRLRSYEQLEIEMHYYMVSEVIKIEKQSSADAAKNIQEMMLRLRHDFAATIDPNTLPLACSNFETNIATRAGDLRYMYANSLKVIRGAQP